MVVEWGPARQVHSEVLRCCYRFEEGGPVADIESVFWLV